METGNFIKNKIQQCYFYILDSYILYIFSIQVIFKKYIKKHIEEMLYQKKI